MINFLSFLFFCKFEPDAKGQYYNITTKVHLFFRKVVFLMAKKGMKIGLALAAALAPQRCWQKQPQKSTKLLLRYQIAITGIQSAENMKKTAKESITATETTKPLPVRKSRKALTIKMPTL